MSNRTDGGFDPETILVALQGAGVASVLIGGLARVARGADEVTRGVDICPSEQPANLERLAIALDSLGAARADGRELELDAAHLVSEPVLELSTGSGELKVIFAPTGVPRGYEALRASATPEHLGAGLRPEIASTADLIAMSAALRREADLDRLPALRRILELEADPAGIVTPQPLVRLKPGAALRGERSFADRSRPSGPRPDIGPAR
jgi:hypothetical protein